MLSVHNVCSVRSCSGHFFLLLKLHFILPCLPAFLHSFLLVLSPTQPPTHPSSQSFERNICYQPGLSHASNNWGCAADYMQFSRKYMLDGLHWWLCECITRAINRLPMQISETLILCHEALCCGFPTTLVKNTFRVKRGSWCDRHPTQSTSAICISQPSASAQKQCLLDAMEVAMNKANPPRVFKHLSEAIPLLYSITAL